jgi:hypothetical protein
MFYAFGAVWLIYSYTPFSSPLITHVYYFQPSRSHFPIAVEAQHIGRVPRPFHPVYPEGKIQNRRTTGSKDLKLSQHKSENGIG